MLYLIWFFLVGSIFIMILDMVLEEWFGMDVVEGGALLLKKFTGGKSGGKKNIPALAAKAGAKPKVHAAVKAKKKKK